MFENVAIGHNTKGTEDDPDRDVDLDVRNGRFDNISNLM